MSVKREVPRAPQHTDVVRQRLGDAVTIRRESFRNGSVESTYLDPSRADACPTSWAELGDSELVLQVGKGGRWELARDVKSVEKIERIVIAVTEGRVTEVFASGRSRINVTFADGTSVHSTEYRTLMGLLPIPGWRRKGRLVAYVPY